MPKIVDKVEFIQRLHARTQGQISKLVLTDVFHAIIAYMTLSLSKDKPIYVKNFGTIHTFNSTETKKIAKFAAHAIFAELIQEKRPFLTGKIVDGSGEVVRIDRRKLNK